MPPRKTPLVNGQYYHLFNRSIGRIPIFNTKSDFKRALATLNYYRFEKLPCSFSTLIKLNKNLKEEILKDLLKEDKLLIEIVCFCLMPNHFHLLIKQIKENGIVKFLRNFQDSYAKYFNMKNQRKGILFESRFKAVLIENDTQLLHLSRYIHLNPYSSLLVKDKKQLLAYNWSSLPQYLEKIDGFCQPEIIMSQFKTKADYWNFVSDQADYQRNLEKIKHLIHE